MTEQEYCVSLQTPIGKRPGRMLARREGNQISGTLSILNHTLPFDGTIGEQGDCSISGTLITLLRTVPYRASGRISNTEVCLQLQGERNCFVLSGMVCSQGEEI